MGVYVNRYLAYQEGQQSNHSIRHLESRQTWHVFDKGSFCDSYFDGSSSSFEPELICNALTGFLHHGSSQGYAHHQNT